MMAKIYLLHSVITKQLSLVQIIIHVTQFYRSNAGHLFIYLFSLYLTLTKYCKQKIHAYNNIKTYNEVFLAYQRYAN